MATPIPPTDDVDTIVHTIGLFERNRSVLRRAARVMHAAANAVPIAAEEDPLALRARLGADVRLLACEASDAELALGWIREICPDACLAAWGHDPLTMLALAEHDDRLVSLLGWPTFQSMPRAWEIALSTRTILRLVARVTGFNDVFVGTPMVVEFEPRTPADRDSVVSEVEDLVQRVGGTQRIASQIGAVAHELIMNATYDAPIDARGNPRYLDDRRAPVVLDDEDLPMVGVATDGLLVALQVTDRFGRLSREHVLSSIRRGEAASHAAASNVVDRSRGGAGLGLWRVYAASAVTIFDIVPGQTTTVTAVFDIDVAAREARTLPPSLHLFDRGRMP